MLVATEAPHPGYAQAYAIKPRLTLRHPILPWSLSEDALNGQEQALVPERTNTLLMQ